MTATNPFPIDALDANRRGQLTDKQRENLGALAAFRRRNALTIAAFLTAGALVVIFLTRPDSPILPRWAMAGGALAIAAFLVVRSITQSDALTRDLEDPQVQSTEGAVGKRRVGGGRARSTYYLEAGDETFKIGSATYNWAPSAGRVRVYFLPQSRSVVNIEVLANPPAPADLSARNVVELLGTTLLSGRREANEARAEMAGISDALRKPFDQPAQPPPAASRDPRPLAEAIVGTWTNGLIHAVFAADGTCVVRMMVSERRGRWSVDAAGRLRANITGAEQTADAWIAGDRLTIALDGAGVTLKRESP